MLLSSDKKHFIFGILKTSKDVYKLTKQRISIGRNKTSQIIINNNTVSKDHAIIEFDEDLNATIKDLNSSNGTFVNGEKLKNFPMRLKNGDKIIFGREGTEYVFESFNKMDDTKTEEDFNQNDNNQYMYNGNNSIMNKNYNYMDNNNNNQQINIKDEKINLVNENEMYMPRMNHLNNLQGQKNINQNYNNNNNYVDIENNSSSNNNYMNNDYNNNYENNGFGYRDENIDIYKKKIDDLEKKVSELESDKIDLVNKNQELSLNLETKNGELKKLSNLFDELNEEYSKLNAKHNTLMIYASDIQKKLDLSNIELNQFKKKYSSNENVNKIIDEKDNIINILQNEIKYYKDLCNKNNLSGYNSFNSNLRNNNFMHEENNNNYEIKKKLDNISDKYITESKKLKKQNILLKNKIKNLIKKINLISSINTNNNINANVDFAQFQTQINYQIDSFNNIISEYNDRLSSSLNKISELFEQSKKEEAAKFLIDQINQQMSENKKLLTENAKLNTQILELQAKLNAKQTVSNNPNNINNLNLLNENFDESDEINNDEEENDNEEIDMLRKKVEELEGIIDKFKKGGEVSIEGGNLRDAFVNVVSELKEKNNTINELQSKIENTIRNKKGMNFDDKQIAESVYQNIDEKDKMIQSLRNKINMEKNDVASQKKIDEIRKNRGYFNNLN